MRNRHANRISLIRTLIRREIEQKYHGSALGVGWYVLSNLATLAIYTVAFGSILDVRWSARTAAPQGAEFTSFAVMAFAGLVVFNLTAECLNRAPTLLLSNVNYVKKIVFPLEILPVVALGAALFNALVAFIVLIIMSLILGTWPSVTAIAAPLALLPLLPLLLGLTWFLAALGVYLRDVTQVVPLLTTVMLFLGPVFFPRSSFPPVLRSFAVLNPITIPIEQLRNMLYQGLWPDLGALGLEFVVASVIGWLGYCWFQQTRRGFADVL